MPVYIRRIASVLGALAIVVTMPVLAGAQISVDSRQPVLAPDKAFNLNLKEAINLALRNNPNVQSAELQRVVDKFALVVANNEFEWQYRLTGNAFWSQSTIDNRAARMRGGNVTPEVKIKSPMGLEFSTSFPQTTNDGSHYHPAISFSAKQPLLRGAGSNINLVNLENAKDQEEINKLALKETLISTVNKVILDYRNVQQTQLSLEIQKNNLEDALDNLKQTQAKIDAGQLPPRNIVEIQRQIADQELQLEVAKNNLNQAVLVLLRDMWINPNTQLTLPNDIESKLEAIPELQSSFETALLYNIQYQTALFSLAQDERAVTVANDKARWQLDLSGAHTFGDGTGGGDNDGLQSLFNGRNDATRVQLDLDIPIDNKPIQQDIVNAKTRLKQSRLRIALLQRELFDSIKTAIRDLTSQRKQVDLSKRAKELAKESLELEKRKQLFGKATLLDVTSARRTLIDAENALVRNKIQYLNTLTEFRRLLGVTLEHWQIEIIL